MRNSSHGAPELLTKHNENCAQWLTNFSHQLRIEMRITKSRISDEQEHSTQQLNNLESLACKLLSKSENKQFHTGDHAGRYNLLLSKLITLTTQTSPGKVSVFTAHELQVVARAVYLTQVDFHQITPVKAATNLLKIGSISIVSTQPITRSVSDRKKRRSPSPTEERGHFIRAKRMLNLMRDHPMATTCLPWKPDDRFHHSRQLLMGSQSCEDRKTVVPLFKHFLCSLAEKNKPYVYINLLKNTRSKFFDFQRTNEAYRSQALHQLEENKKTLFARSIHVISLPADDKILNGYSLNYSLSTLLKRAVKGISNTDHDFRMSDETKVILFSGTDDVNIRTIIRRLLTLSYYTMHSVSTPLIWDQTLDRKKVKAVWFDFIKLRLTHYIIETFKPIYFNISCKDAIDRAAVHSLYYNKYREDMGRPQSLSSNNSIIDDSSDSETEENTEPLLKTELDLLATKETKLLNYRARLVKDRGINRHGDLYREVDTIRKSIRINTQKHSLYL